MRADERELISILSAFAYPASGIAFTDMTNGFTTYGGGRYLEYTTDDIAKEMYLDFNYCFNPYCAYTDGYNCVIPPAENALSVPINAGVKKYHN